MKIKRPDGFIYNGKTRDFKKQTANDRVNQQNNSCHFPPPLFHCLSLTVYCLLLLPGYRLLRRSPESFGQVAGQFSLPSTDCPITGLPFAYCPLPTAYCLLTYSTAPNIREE